MGYGTVGASARTPESHRGYSDEELRQRVLEKRRAYYAEHGTTRGWRDSLTPAEREQYESRGGWNGFLGYEGTDNHDGDSAQETHTVRDVIKGKTKDVGNSLSKEDRARQRIDEEYSRMRGEMPSVDAMRIGEDSGAVDAQRAALARLQEIGQGQYSAEDRARQQQMQRDNALQEQSQRAAVMQQAQARGMGRSGTQLAGSLAAQQGAANRNNQQSLGIEAMAQQRALQALQGGAGLATQMRQQGQNVAQFNSMAADRRFGMQRDASALKLGQYRPTDDQKGVLDYAAGIATAIGV